MVAHLLPAWRKLAHEGFSAELQVRALVETVAWHKEELLLKTNKIKSILLVVPSLRSLTELAYTRGDHLFNQTRASMLIDQTLNLDEQVLTKVLRILNQNGIVVDGQWSKKKSVNLRMTLQMPPIVIVYTISLIIVGVVEVMMYKMNVV